MSGDVQPRKRKDKKKKKDDLGIEEPRGTAAALGEGDIFMHSHHDHGTGGHWCAKVIFFALLAVLVSLVGLIILENRGLSELEANSVESRYSGVLEGWLEEGNDHHHDEHTLELNNHDNEDDEHALEHDDDDETEENEEEQNHENEEDEDDEDEDDDDNDEQSQEEEDEDDEDEDDDDDIQTQEEEDEMQNQDDDDEQYQEEYDEDEQNQDDEDEDDVQNQDDDNDDDDNEGNQDSNDEGEQGQDEAYQKDANFQQAHDDDSEEQNLEMAEDEDDIEEKSYRRYYRNTDNLNKGYGGDNDEDLEKTNDDQSAENNDENEDDLQNDSKENEDNEQYGNNDSQENYDDNDRHQLNTDDKKENDADEDDEDHEDHNDHDEDDEVDLEHIEEEVFDEEVSKEAPARKPEDSEEISRETSHVADRDEDEIELLEPDDSDELPEELPIPMPKGKPLIEVEDTPSTERPQDTLADEEEYERQQEALRKEKEEASQGMWLKLVVGGALLVATQAVLRRATAPRDNEDEVDSTREETPLSDRRLTLIAEPVPPPVVPKPVLQKEMVRKAPVVKSAPPPPEDEEEDVEVEEEESKNDENVAAEKDKELYSDEEEEEEDAQEKEPPKPIASIKESRKTPISKPTTPSKMPPVTELAQKKEPPKEVKKEPTPEDEDDDVEIIDEEDLEEEDEDISDVDDAELLNRLEAKYGRLPEPGRQKDGGNSIEDEWPGETSDAYWREELDGAERDLRQGDWTSAVERAGAAVLRSSARARYIIAKALDLLAEAKRDNGILSKAIAAYLELLKMNEKLSDKKLLEVTERALDRMKFKGNYLSMEPIYKLLFRRFPNDANHRNNLTISFLMANRVDLAEEVLKETLKLWPNDRLALAHHGFILKTRHNKQEEAVDAFMKALDGDTGPANEPRYYYHLGDSLLLLGRFKEADEVHKRGAKLGHFLSPVQRSLYNVERLKSQPWWDVEKTPYSRLARALEKSFKEILREGRAAQELYEKEKEGLKQKGEWSQLDLFARGREVEGRCARAPVTCGIVRSETAASGCRRGQIKFSLMEAGTHVRPHVGPTNCRLRMHLGLSNTKDTFIRVDQEIRQWRTGKVLMFDDSFEHEVWHNGTGARLVLIVDVWHPDLTRAERTQLPAI